MRIHAPLLLLVSAAAAAAALPETPKRPVTDEYHGVKVTDPYRWLEDTDAPEVAAWSRAQTAVTRATLDAVPVRAEARRRIEDYFHRFEPYYYGLEPRGETIFALKFQPPKDQPLLVALKSADDVSGERVLVDPNAQDARGHLAIDWYVPSRDGRYVAVAMSEKGSEDAVLHIVDAATGRELPDRVPRVNYPTGGGHAAWKGDDSGVYYTRYPQGDERPKEDRNFYQQVYFHALGTPPSSDAYVIGKDFPRIAETKLDMSADGRRLLVTVANGDGGEFAHYLMGPDGTWTRLTKYSDKIVAAELGPDDALYMISRKDAPRGKILRLPLADPRLSKAKVIVPQGAVALESQFRGAATLVPTRTKLYSLQLDGGPSVVAVYDHAGRKLGTLPLPAVPSVTELPRDGDDGVLARVLTYLDPAIWYRYDGKTLTKTALVMKAPVDFSDAEVVREWATSKDGTKVPMSVIRRKGTKLDGSSPALLYAYGGYGISMKPRFLGIRGRLWLDAGGVYVVGNIRGGGEFGEDWHLSGNLTKKQNVFDDFLACAEHLIAAGYTKPERLVIEGGSNGGLLMGAALTQRPDLFRAVVSHVGIYDMLRVELDPNGAFNTTEFGSVKDPAQFKALYAYSPYHRVADGTAYPAVLLMTGEHDGRVNPANSRKMAARLQAATSSGRPVLLRVSLDSGHGMGTALSEQIEQEADAHAFLMDRLGLVKSLPPVFDPAAIDASADACSDFYQYACGSWLKANPIPPDQSRWWRFSALDEHTRSVLADILEEAAAGKGAATANRRKIGDFYASCLDEAAVEAKGLAPFRPELDRAAALASKGELAAEIARLHGLGAGALFSLSSAQDYEDASMMIAQADQGGFALPDRDYYLTDEFKGEREGYARHLKKTFALLGDAPQTAAAEADAVLRVETALAKAAMGRVERREPKNVHHKMTRAAFAALTPSFDWTAYLSGAGAPAFETLDVSDPGFFRGLEEALKTVPLADWRAYLRWTIVHSLASMGPKALVDEDFDFFGRTLGGQPENKARWKRCVAYTDAGLGEALGQAYVEREFSPQAKARVLTMVHEIEKAMGDDVRSLPWMSAKTKERALEKLAGVANKIGYPDKWRDYSALEIVRGDALGNAERAAGFELRRQLAKIGKPVDRGEWDMTPPTDNAYYDPQMNDINFPAGILQPPNFDMKADDAANYGALVAVVGHELTHGFDDEGRHYDARGNLRDWWTDADGKAFEERAAGLVAEYGAFTAVQDVKLDGRLTLGENTADNGGLLLAYDAFENTPGAKAAADASGYTPEQRFFLSYGQSWCVNRTDAYAKKAAKTDPHSPGKFRVNGVVSNSLEFRKAFSCREGAPMAPAKINRVW